MGRDCSAATAAQLRAAWRFPDWTAVGCARERLAPPASPGPVPRIVRPVPAVAGWYARDAASRSIRPPAGGRSCDADAGRIGSGAAVGRRSLTPRSAAPLAATLTRIALGPFKPSRVASRRPVKGNAATPCVVRSRDPTGVPSHARHNRGPATSRRRRWPPVPAVPALGLLRTASRLAGDRTLRQELFHFRRSLSRPTTGRNIRASTRIPQNFPTPRPHLSTPRSQVLAPKATPRCKTRWKT